MKLAAISEAGQHWRQLQERGLEGTAGAAATELERRVDVQATSGVVFRALRADSGGGCLVGFALLRSWMCDFHLSLCLDGLY